MAPDFDTKPLVPPPPSHPLCYFLNNLTYRLPDLVAPAKCFDPQIFPPCDQATIYPNTCHYRQSHLIIGHGNYSTKIQIFIFHAKLICYVILRHDFSATPMVFI